MAGTTLPKAAPTNVDPAPSSPQSPTGRGRSFAVLQVLLRQREATVIVVTLAVVLYFGFVNSAFFTTGNIITICQYMASIAVIGFGEVLILVLGEIDLSAGAVYLTSPWLVYFLWKDGIPIGLAIALALACCVGIGLVNGLITVWLNVSSLIVTLAVNYILFGFVLITSADIQEDMPGQGGTFGKIFGIGDWSTILWAAGVSATPLTQKLGVELDRAGRVKVNPDLSLPGHPEIFVCGDLAHVEQNGRQIPGVAQPAMQMGDHVARMIEADLNHQPRKPFHYFDKGDMATIGRLAAVAKVEWPFKAHFSGFMAWISWLVVHIYFLIGFRNRLAVLSQWIWSYFTFTYGVRLIYGSQSLPGWTDKDGVEVHPAEPTADEPPSKSAAAD